MCVFIVYTENNLHCFVQKYLTCKNICGRFITELSAGDELGILTFSDKLAKINLEPTIVTSSNKEGLHGRVPGK